MDAERKLDIVQGIVRHGLKGAGVDALLVDFCERVTRAGIPLMRANLSQMTIHPTIVGHDYQWWSDKEEAIVDNWIRSSTRVMTDEDILKMPFGYMALNELPTLRIKLEKTNEPTQFEVVDALREKGATDYFAIETNFESSFDRGPFKGFRTSFTTREAGGFRDSDIDTLSALMPSLGLAIKGSSTYRVAKNLMETYLGEDAGNRVLNGEIVRGSVETIRAVLFSCDLQGFTRLSEQTDGEELIGLLNDYFESVVSALDEQGGEVLKFMGDGLMAIFRLEDNKDVCRAALDATEAARKNLHALNEARRAEGKSTSNVYIALHLGDVMYGNIGSADRLDFTVIGPAVNEAARIESMCRAVDQDVVISSAFRDGTQPDSQNRLVSLGRYALRGVRRPQELFTLDPEPDAA